MVNKMALFDRAFRPFFLFGTTFSFFAITLWMFYWLGFSGVSIALPVPLFSWQWWHGHEMLFGFAVAIIVGFLLTAVQNWTGVATPSGVKLALLFSLWLLSRVLMFVPVVIEWWALALVDSLFLVAAAYFFGEAIVLGKNWRNLFFVPIFLVMAVLNVLSYYYASEGLPAKAHQVQLGVAFWITLIMVVMSGRVIPFFTSRGASVTLVEGSKLTESIALLSIAVVAILQSVPDATLVPDWLMSLSLFIAFFSNLLRLIRWKSLATAGIPLLWSLHLAYAFIVISLLALSLYYLGLLHDLDALFHFLNIGGVGLLVLAMISRISLGHTGRPLTVGKLMVLAYIALAASAVLRVFSSWLFGLEFISLAYSLSAVLWLLSFGLFIGHYFKVLILPRVKT